MKKIYSYCSIGNKNYGTIEGIVLSMKVRNYIKEDGSPGEMLTFGLSCRNVDEKIKVVKYLQEKGTFKVKGAIVLVAEKLAVSEPTVYRYLKKNV